MKGWSSFPNAGVGQGAPQMAAQMTANSYNMCDMISQCSDPMPPVLTRTFGVQSQATTANSTPNFPLAFQGPNPSQGMYGVMPYDMRGQSLEQVQPSQNFGGEEEMQMAMKRPRLIWTEQLHERFVEAVNEMGVDQAVPKAIMQSMNIKGITRENVASHLQKYRQSLKKEAQAQA